MEFPIIKATPTCSGNGFTAGNIYTFKALIDIPTPGMLYATNSDKGYERVVNRESLFDGQKYAHLWDGVNWNAAGTFIIISKEESHV
jgi:hypothetical protein